MESGSASEYCGIFMARPATGLFTYRQIAAHLGISVRRVQQIEQSALTKIRAGLDLEPNWVPVWWARHQKRRGK